MIESRVFLPRGRDGGRTHGRPRAWSLPGFQDLDPEPQTLNPLRFFWIRSAGIPCYAAQLCQTGFVDCLQAAGSGTVSYPRT